MPITLLADENVEGQVARLLTERRREYWRIFWVELNSRSVRLGEIGLSKGVADSVIWQTCQKLEIYLITGNRNREGPDSLEATIRDHSTPQTFPVFTLSNSHKMLQSRAYVERIAVRLYELLLQEDSIRGSGRLYLP
ncbi:hypothetical protein BH10PLA2_BH10PLA2_16500 [soil metagenome]